jgi:transcription-repair coupling factor (superfamily II helicase)
MNERIKELARQAWKEAYNVDPADPRIARAHKAMEEGMEKFAELIVRECATVCDEIAGMAEITNTGEMARKTKATAVSCSNFIKNRFGVEE